MPLDAYIRVSQVKGRSGPRFISPSLQLERIQRWATYNSVMIAEVHEELDQSGARSDRPLLQHVIQRVERGESDGIVVARLDRFGRSLLDGLAAIQRIDQAGGTFVSVDNGLDIRTDVGRLVLRLMLSLAEYELDRIKQGWEDARRRAVERGVYCSSEAPSGYTRTRSGRLKVDPVLAPWVRGIFERRAGGQSYRQISRWLEEQQVPTARGNPIWKTSLLVTVLKNRAYLGESHVGDIRNPTAHEPLIDPVTFAAAQRPLDRSPGGVRHKRLLTGLVRCAHCSRICTTCNTRTSGLIYMCKGTLSSGRCPSPAMISARNLEEFVLAEFRTTLKRRSRPSAAVSKTEARLAETRADFERYRDSARIRSTLGEQRFAEGLERRLKLLDTAALVAASATRRAQPPTVTTSQWDALSQREQHQIVRDAMDCVIVVRAWAPPQERAFICWRGEAPLDLPRRGQKLGSKPFNPEDCQGAAARRELPPAFDLWDRTRIRTALLEMIGERDHFPTINWFRNREGGSELYTQVRLTGGRTHWARELDMPTLRQKGKLRLTDDQIIARLDPFVGPTGIPPIYAQLMKGDDSALWTALERRGGVEVWTARVMAARLQQDASNSDAHRLEELIPEGPSARGA